ncbi:MAG: molybdate ABC transporter substrate-binding protein [Deltaproteobacteria bacterium]|nr:molybdate ABC transporter substrate-binding protein [Deltaproteobacteria bacterium]
MKIILHLEEFLLAGSGLPVTGIGPTLRRQETGMRVAQTGTLENHSLSFSQFAPIRSRLEDLIMSKKNGIYFIPIIALIFLGFLSGPAHSQCTVVGDGAQMVELAVAANFAKPIADIIENYFFTVPTYASAYKFDLCSGATGNFLTEIENAGIGNSPYDILFAANKEAPDELETKGFSVGSSTTYVFGRLALFSNNSGPVIGPDDTDAVTALSADSFSGDIVVADTDKAPYGAAAKEVLMKPNININNQYVTAAGALTGLITVVSDIGQVYTTVLNGGTTYPLGFVAASDICGRYVDNPDDPHIWMVNQSYYKQLQQAAVTLKSQHGAPATTGAQTLLDYILNNTDVRDKLVDSYCYSLPTKKTGKLNASPFLSLFPSVASHSLPSGVPNAILHENPFLLRDVALSHFSFSGRSGALWR